MTAADQPSAACRWCGEQHGPLCPWVAALEFGPFGNVTRVEFHRVDGGARSRQDGPPSDEDPRDYPRMKGVE